MNLRTDPFVVLLAASGRLKSSKLGELAIELVGCLAAHHMRLLRLEACLCRSLGDIRTTPFEHLSFARATNTVRDLNLAIGGSLYAGLLGSPVMETMMMKHCC